MSSVPEGAGPPIRRKDTADLVYKDDLTDLYNRRYLRKYFAASVVEGDSPKPHSLLMLDLDHFKRINDTLGHKCGDQVLIHTARILRASFRASDIVVRYAGDEFVVVLPGTDKQVTASLAERMRKQILGSPFVHQAGLPPVIIDVSVGVANLPTDARNVDELLDQADRALYHAKRTGRGRVSVAGGAVSSVATDLDLMRRFPCPTLIGRAELSKRLATFLPTPLAPVRFVLLKGRAGVGKSRLLGELRDKAQQAGIPVCLVTCAGEDTLLPYHCITRVLDELLVRDPDTVEKVMAGVSDEGLYCLRRAIPHLPIKKDLSRITLPPQTQRHVMFRTLVDLVARFVELRPLVVILDEIQNVDLGTMTLALALRNKGVRNLIFYGAAQPHVLDEAIKLQTPLGTFFSVVKSEHFFAHFDVPPFRRDDTNAMIRAVLPNLPASQQLEDLIWSASGGNPLFIQAHLKALIAQGQISIRDGVLALDLTAQGEAPKNMEEAVMSNLSVLDRETSDLVTDAAVAGPVVELEMLQAIAGLREGHAQEIVDKAEKAAILTKEEAEADRLKFASEVVREVTYQRADEDRRRRTHGKVGQFIEEKHKENPDAAAAELAYHYGRSDQQEKAAEYQSRVRSLARALFDPSENLQLAARKVADKIAPSQAVLSASSAARILPLARLILEAVEKIKSAPSDLESLRPPAAPVREALLAILKNDNPLTLSAADEKIVANELDVAGAPADHTPKVFREMLLGHNAKTLTFRLGVDIREISLLLTAFSHQADVHVGFLWPIWLGENEIKNIYVEPEVQTARLLREGDGLAVSFASMLGEVPAKPKAEARTESAEAETAEPTQGPTLRQRLGGGGVHAEAAGKRDAAAQAITRKEERDRLFMAFDEAMIAGRREALGPLVDTVKTCLTHPWSEVRFYAGHLVEMVLPRCSVHKCEYLEDMITGILCEVMGREGDARVFGRLARAASDTAFRMLQRGDYDGVRKIISSFTRPNQPGTAGLAIRAQKAGALQYLLNSAFFGVLLDDMTSADPARASAADFVLASFGDQVVPRAVRALAECESVRTRLALVNFLCTQAQPALVLIKEQFATGTQPVQLRRILSVLGEMLPESRDVINLALDHPSDDVAVEAVGALGKLPAGQCEQAMALLLNHRRTAVRVEALRWIGDLKLTSLEAAVQGMLSSKSVEVLREACMALGKMGRASSVPLLYRLVRRGGFLGLFGRRHPTVRSAAAWALGQIGDPRALPVLRKAALDSDPAIQSSAERAIEILERSGKTA